MGPALTLDTKDVNQDIHTPSPGVQTAYQQEHQQPGAPGGSGVGPVNTYNPKSPKPQPKTVNGVPTWKLG